MLPSHLAVSVTDWFQSVALGPRRPAGMQTLVLAFKARRVKPHNSTSLSTSRRCKHFEMAGGGCLNSTTEQITHSGSQCLSQCPGHVCNCPLCLPLTYQPCSLEDQAHIIPWLSPTLRSCPMFIFFPNTQTSCVKLAGTSSLQPAGYMQPRKAMKADQRSCKLT